MIGYIKGQILDQEEGKLVVGVGDPGFKSGVVGYSVSVPGTANYSGLGPGQEIELRVHTHVREDAFDLYGFCTKLEKALFLILLGVNGIGPKSALGILSRVEPETLIDAILQGDQAALTKIPGIGKKTAERVIIELRDEVRKKVEAGILIPSSRKPALEKGEGKLVDPGQRASQSQWIQDAKAALLGLGYRETEFYPLLNRAIQGEGSCPRGPEDLIRMVLRQLA